MVVLTQQSYDILPQKGKFHDQVSSIIYAFFDSLKKHGDEMSSARKAQYDPKQLYTVDVDADQVMYGATAHVIMRGTVLLTMNSRGTR